MVNGDIEDAQIEALLSGSRRTVERCVLTGLKQLTLSVDAMKRTCEERGKVCPVINGDARRISQAAVSVAEAAAKAAAIKAEGVNRRVWVMWGVGIFLGVTVSNAIIVYGLERVFR